MAAKQHHVYAKCWAGSRRYLQTMFSGSRGQCETYIKQRIRNNRPTHFLLISSLDIDAASKRYLD